MKKTITILLAAALMLSMAACGGDSTTPSGNETTPPPSSTPTQEDSTATPEIKELVLGETAATDIIEVTWDKADLAIALVNTSGNEMFLPKDYDSDEDSKNPFVASKGHTFVVITYTVNNLDRSSVDLGSYYVSAEYKDTSSTPGVHHGAESVETGNL